MKRFLLLSFIVLAFTGCAINPEKYIIGDWYLYDTVGDLTYKDAKMSIKSDGVVYVYEKSGEYCLGLTGYVLKRVFGGEVQTPTPSWDLLESGCYVLDGEYLYISIDEITYEYILESGNLVSTSDESIVFQK